MVLTFLYALAGGMLAVIASARVEQIAARFLRIIGLICFALSCCVAVWMVREEPSINEGGVWPFWLGLVHAVVAAVVALTAPFAERRPRFFRLLCMAGGLPALAAACLRSLALVGSEESSLPVDGLTLLGQLLGGLLLGSITVAWLLGHAYLTATRMTIAPLKHFSRLLSWALAVRIVFLVASLTVAWIVAQDAGSPVFVALKQAWLIVTLRVVVGLVGLVVFVYMVGDCVRLRSTQSATGILYFASLFAYIGELASQYLLGECGWPL